MNRWLSYPLAALVAAFLAGCGDSSASDDDEGNLSQAGPTAQEQAACETATVGENGAGEQVVLCEKTFDEAPRIRLPKDKKTSSSLTFYAGVTLPTGFGGAFVVWGRDGKQYVPVDKHGEPIPFGTEALPKPLQVFTNRVTYTIYQLTGKVGAEIESPLGGTARKIRLTKARSVLSIEGCAFDSHLLGTWEGTVSERVEGDPMGALAKQFDESKRVPIHVTFHAAKKSVPLADANGSPLDDADTFHLTGTIDNFDEDFEADGKTYPSLSALAERSPFLGATKGDVELYRLGAMHGLKNDAHWVLDYPTGSEKLTINGMSQGLLPYTAPYFLLEGDAPDVLRTIEIRPHIPFNKNGHSVVLTPIEIERRIGECD